jgi:hypothetical protein
MKASDVQVGGSYMAKVSDKVVAVQIIEERWIGNAHQGWKAKNLQTGKAVTIKSAQRLRGVAGAAPEGDGQPHGGEQAQAPKAPTPPTTAAEPTAPVPDAAATTPAVAKPAKEPKPKATRAKAPAAAAVAKPKRTSGLDAAAQVLKDAGRPMNSKEIAAEILGKGLWKTTGKTPEATLYAACLREIQAKGTEARFVKTDRGLFAFNKAG